MQNILFRANSSSTLGVGHIMRDLVLASQFKDARVIFATEELPGNINEKIQEQNYLIEILNSNNLEELVLLIKKHSIDTVVIDHYAIDYDFEKALKRATGVIIFALDDTYQKHYSDILLNHNVYADSDKYIDLVPKNSEVRCGSKYTLLRNEFIKEKKKGRQFILIKPTTFMNRSGKAVRYWALKENIPLENILILTDEIHLPFGTLRIKGKGSPAGHNGLKDIENELNTPHYARLRFGIGQDPKPFDQVKFVLDSWNTTEEKVLTLRIEKCGEAIVSFGLEGLSTAMNRHNGK